MDCPKWSKDEGKYVFEQTKRVKFLMTLKDAHYINNILSSHYVGLSESIFTKDDKDKLKQLDRITDNLVKSIRKSFNQNRGFPYDNSYKEYKKLGGKSSENEYFKNYDIFINETRDIFIDGNQIKHNSRNEALKAVIKRAKISVKELNLIFNSVDNITSYT